MLKRIIAIAIWIFPLMMDAQKTGVGTNQPQARFHIAVPQTWTDSIFMIHRDTSTVIFVVTSSGRVGILQGKPLYQLDVGGNLGSSSLAGFSKRLIIVRPDGTLDTLIASGDSTQVLLGNMTWGPYPGGTNQDTLWADAGQYIYPIVAWQDTIVITDSGWLGIQTTNPGAPLHIDTGLWWFTNTNQCILIGYGTGKNLITGSRNVIIGDSAGFYVQTASENVFVGSNAGKNVNTGTVNTVLGASAMRTAEGNYVIAIGCKALGGTNGGVLFATTAIGNKAGYNCSSCNQSILIGGDAGYSLETGNGNIAIGTSALKSHTSVSGAVAIGVGALESQRSGLFISPQVAIGTGALNQDTSGTGNTVIGGFAMTNAHNSILTTAVGFGSGREISNPQYSTFVGTEAGGRVAPNLQAKHITAVGFRALYGGDHAYSTAVGSNAGENLVSAERVTLIGSMSATQVDSLSSSVVAGSYAAHSANASFYENLIAIGDSSMFRGTGDNIAIGKNTLMKISKPRNIAIGYGAMQDATSATKSIAIGKDVMSKIQFGENNVAVGLSVLKNVQYAKENTFVGHQAGWKIDSAEGNIAIGAQTLQEPSTFVKYNIAIGSRAMEKPSSPDSLHRNIAIGFKALGATTGIPRWNIAIGAYAMEQARKHHNIALGAYALRNCKWCTYNIGLGYMTLATDTTSSYNIAIGYNAMGGGQPADSNIAVGYGAMSKAYGKNNIGIGYLAMAGTPIRGNNNISMGAMSMAFTGGDITGNNNIAIGVKSLASVTSGSNNIAVGYKSLASLTTGSENIAFGATALYSMKTGTGNIAIGAGALYNDTVGSNNIAIGFGAMHKASAMGNSNIALGSPSMLDGGTGIGNVFMGILSPDTGIQINGVYNVGIGYKTYTAIRGTGSFFGSYNTAVGSESGPAGHFDNTAALGYQAQPIASNRIHIGNNQTISIGVPVAWSTYSDKRWKTNVKDDVPGLDFILRLRPVTYKKNPILQEQIMYSRNNMDSSMFRSMAIFDTLRFSGFIAQEVDSIARLIGYDFSGVRAPDDIGGDGIAYSISYADFVVPLVKAIQEQQQLIEQRKQLIAENEKLLKELRALDRYLEEELKKLQGQ
ncbi:MAG: hypothetical protein GXO48_02575 [Chlorobi bacterium]|nr:hypothetical protein [Chlorobiota bacterium]